ncbi:peptidoglycan bridge formation glycyltransferase FemA/FemB family protein [Candidatus Peregrinibacteria bacterium]|nr:peptidoglycan bridge formation glycyltransferase FemA/FemB family protein [Candidatus Peregrinibacteria bacterium]
MKKLAPIAKQERAVFVRIDPPIEISAAQKFPAGFRNAHAEYQPAHTLVIDLSQTEEQILAQMKPKGRYNIKVAQKHNVIVRPATTATLKRDISAFYKLLNQTSQRDKFSIHPKSYYENMLKILGQRNLTKLFIAEYAPAGHTAAHNRAKKIIAGIIVTFFSTTATYYFGASDYEYRNLMAPYLLQWEAICEAKSSGCKFYDFLGIAPLDSSGAPLRGHPYAALTDFKLKFGGRIVSYAPAKEFAYKPIWYSLMKFAKKLI